MKKKILMFGPISDFGGRELETGFIAETLSSLYDVDICSSGIMTKKSQVFDFNKNQNVFTLNQLLCDKYVDLRLSSFLGYLKNKRNFTASDYVNNRFSKRYLGYNKKLYLTLGNLISQYDLIFICAQLSSDLISEVVDLAKTKGKKILFRTTGAISNIKCDFVQDVDCFIHHSFKNVENLMKVTNHNFEIIDQCAFNENKLLEIPNVKNEICNFLILSRLSPDKGVEGIIDFFLRVGSENDMLFIAGNGILENYLKTKYEESRNIKFLGFLNGTKLLDLFREIDCLIIPSPEESGPLVGVESMSAGKIIISTKVGAMQERMEDTSNDYWFDYGNFESFEKVFFEVKCLNESQISKVSVSLREKYINEYSNYSIRGKYINLVNKILNENRFQYLKE